MEQEQAELFALKSLEWIAQEEDRLRSFLQWSGITAASSHNLPISPEMLVAVLDFVLLQDSQVMECAASIGVSPEDIGRIHAALPGGGHHWNSVD